MPSLLSIFLISISLSAAGIISSPPSSLSLGSDFPSIASGSSNVSAFDRDSVSASFFRHDISPWTVKNCGSFEGRLTEQLWYIKDNLSAVSDEARRGTGTESKAFAAIFKNDRNIEKVIDIYDGMMTGVTPDWRGFEDERTPKTPIVFECIGPYSKNERDRKLCESQRFNAFTDSSDQIVRLCDVFWRLEFSEPQAELCPRRSRLFQRWKCVDMCNRQGILVHELAHIYLGKDQLGPMFFDPVTRHITYLPGGGPEIQDVDALLKMDAADTIRNAESFGLFYNSYIAHCPLWPAPRKLSVGNEEFDDVETRIKI